MTDLTNRGEILLRYRELGPDPDPEAADPSRDLARALIVSAYRRLILFRAADRTAVPDLDSASVLCAQFAGVHPLMHLRRNEPGTAARKARQVARAWGSGAELGAWLEEHARDVGLDPGELRALAEAEHAVTAADPAPTLAQRADQAEANARGMAELIRRGALTVRAAAIEAERGDLRAAGELLREIADPGDFPAWDGAQTGREWLADALHAVPEPLPDPEPEPAAEDEPLAARREPAPTEAWEMAPELDAGRADAADTLTMTAVAR